MKVFLYMLILHVFYNGDVLAFPLSTIFGTTDDPQLPAKCYGNDLSESLKSGINDIVVVEQSYGILKSTPLQARIGKLTNMKTLFKSREGRNAKLYINNVRALHNAGIILSDSGAVFIKRRRAPPTCVFTNDELQRMHLNEGRNRAILVVNDLDIELTFSIYLFNQRNKLVITDIDGTITTTDFRGFIGGQIGVDVHHPNVIEFFDKVADNGYTLVYLTARPMAFDGWTREYLFDTLQNCSDRGYSLPMSPLFMSPISSKAAITADAETMKVEALRSLLDLFDLKQDAAVGAYGNKNTDTEAYLKAGIRGKHTFLINEDSEMMNVATGEGTSYQTQVQHVNTLYPTL